MRRLLPLGLLTVVLAGNIAAAIAQINQNGRVGEDKTTGIDQVILEEYKALRAEIILCLEGRVSILSFGFTAVGALLGVGAALMSKKPYLFSSALVIGVGVSLTSVYVLDVWSVETRRLARASSYNCYLEKKINNLFPGDVKALEWEERVRNDSTYKSFLLWDREIPWIFIDVAFASVVAGSILFWRGIDKEDHPRFVRYRIPSLLVVGLPLLWFVFQRYRELEYLKKIWSIVAC